MKRCQPTRKINCSAHRQSGEYRGMAGHLTTLAATALRVVQAYAAFFGMTSRSITALSMESRSKRFWMFSQYCAEVPK